MSLSLVCVRCWFWRFRCCSTAAVLQWVSAPRSLKWGPFVLDPQNCDAPRSPRGISFRPNRSMRGGFVSLSRSLIRFRLLRPAPPIWAGSILPLWKKRAGAAKKGAGSTRTNKDGEKRRENGAKTTPWGRRAGSVLIPNEGARRRRQILGGFGRSAWRWFRLSSMVVRV